MIYKGRCELTLTLDTVPSEALPAPAVVRPGARGDTLSLVVTGRLPRLTDVHRVAGGVGGVQSVSLLTAAGVAALQVDTQSVLQ